MSRESSRTDRQVAAGEFVVEPTVRSVGALRAKRFLQSAFLPLVAHRLAAQAVMRPIVGRERAFQAASESIARIPGNRGIFSRQAFYRHTLAGCGLDVYFGWLSVFSTPLATVGERAYIGRGCSIGFAEIGAQTLLADGVQILSGAHQHGRGDAAGSHQDEAQVFRRVRIGAGAWLGAGAIIMADVGAGAIVGAGAVVTREIPARTIATGLPARVVKELD